MKELLHRKKAWTLVIYSAVTLALVLQQLFLKPGMALIALSIALLLAAAWRFKLHKPAKLLHGIVISYGSVVFGFIFYMALPQPHSENLAEQASPPQRFDIVIFGPLFGLFFLALTLFYYYRLRRTENTVLETYFSYVLFIAMSAATLYSMIF